MNSDSLKRMILDNAVEIARLHSCMHATAKVRDDSPEARLAWKKACAEFHDRYAQLAFPGSYAGALGRIDSGDQETIEIALCFLECRPYFFRSGYMFKDILRRCKRAQLSARQKARLDAVLIKLEEWKRSKSGNDLSEQA